MLTFEQMKTLYRDFAVAWEIGEKAELGYFEAEIDTFGYVVLNDDERHYHISTCAGKMYEEFDKAIVYDEYPTLICNSAFRKAIPKGFREDIELELKQKLAKELQCMYSIDFLNMLNDIAFSLTQNTAYTLLENYLKDLEYSFNIDKLNMFEETLIMATSQKKLNQSSMQILTLQSAEEKKYILDDMKPKDIFSMIFYSFAYIENGKKTIIYDARKEYIYSKKIEKELSGAIVSPIFSKQCFYNYSFRVSDARKAFRKYIDFIFDEEYMKLLLAIRALPPKMTSEDFYTKVHSVKKMYGEKPYETMLYYGHKWAII